MDKHKPGDVWLQPIHLIKRYWNSIDGNFGGLPSYFNAWTNHLAEVRQDDAYAYAWQSLVRYGWKKPVTSTCGGKPDDFWTKSVVYFGDGHHRLAAAIDLGAKVVPMMRARPFDFDHLVAKDSGCYLGEPIRRSQMGAFRDLSIPKFSKLEG